MRRLRLVKLAALEALVSAQRLLRLAKLPQLAHKPSKFCTARLEALRLTCCTLSVWLLWLPLLRCYFLYSSVLPLRTDEVSARGMRRRMPRKNTKRDAAIRDKRRIRHHILKRHGRTLRSRRRPCAAWSRRRRRLREAQHQRDVVRGEEAEHDAAQEARVEAQQANHDEPGRRQRQATSWKSSTAQKARTSRACTECSTRRRALGSSGTRECKAAATAASRARP